VHFTVFLSDLEPLISLYMAGLFGYLIDPAPQVWYEFGFLFGVSEADGMAGNCILGPMNWVNEWMGWDELCLAAGNVYVIHAIRFVRDGLEWDPFRSLWDRGYRRSEWSRPSYALEIGSREGLMPW